MLEKELKRCPAKLSAAWNLESRGLSGARVSWSGPLGVQGKPIERKKGTNRKIKRLIIFRCQDFKGSPIFLLNSFAKICRKMNSIINTYQTELSVRY